MFLFYHQTTAEIPSKVLPFAVAQPHRISLYRENVAFITLHFCPKVVIFIYVYAVLHIVATQIDHLCVYTRVGELPIQSYTHT